MSNRRMKDKNRRARLSLQNRDLVRNQLNLVIDNMGIKKEEADVTEEEDPLKFFSQQQRKKEKEEEAKKYLQKIDEEDDPLKFFENKEAEEGEKEQDPLKFLKNEENPDDPKVLGNLALHDEKKLAEAIKNNDIPEEIVINKESKESANPHDKQKKMEKRLNTAMRFSQRKDVVRKLNDKLLDRLKNTKNVGNTEAALKATDNNSKTDNTILGAENQIDPTKNNQPVKQTKEVDLKSFMEKKPK
jgi:hypothetical protein